MIIRDQLTPYAYYKLLEYNNPNSRASHIIVQEDRFGNINYRYIYDLTEIKESLVDTWVTITQKEFS